MPLARPVLLLQALLLIGCGAFWSPQITRRVGGESRPGNYVSPYSYEHFIRGELAEMRGDLREAAEEYRLSRAGPADDPFVLARLADVLDRLGRESEAAQILDQADELDPDDETVWLTRGRIHQRHGRMEPAREAYSHAAASAPESEAGPIALAALLREMDEHTRADAVLERYLARARGAGAARARLALALDDEDPLAAADAVRALLEAAPARADEVRSAATAALEGGHPELALRLLAALPELPEDRPLRLRALIEAGERERAEGLLAAWMPAETHEMLRVAEGYLAIGQPERAHELADVAVRTDGGPPARLVLGRALAALGRHAEAAILLAAIEPGGAAWPAAPIALADALRDTGQPAAAAETLSRAIARRPSPALHLALSEARIAAGDGPGAIAALEGASPTLRAARARALDRLGRHDEATAAYAEVSLDAPAVPELDRLRARAEAAARRGETERAITILRQLVERSPEESAARARLGALGG